MPLLTPRTELARAAIVNWPQLLEAARRQPFPEAWWLAQERDCLLIEAEATALAAAASANAALSACDTRTTRPEEAVLIARNCARAPLAALALVQVLRITEHLAPAQGLLTESLAYATLQAGPEFSRWRKDYATRPALPDEGPAVCIDRHGDALSIRLNRPRARNALNIAMRDALVEAFDLLSSDASIATATVSGAGRCYSVGGDLNEFGERPDAPSAHRIRSLRNPALSLLRCARRVEFHVHSACIGSGIELAAFGRRIRAHRDAYFQLPELKLGLIPGSGGLVSLPQRIGRQRTALLALTGRRLAAREALAWGLVDELSD